jgi:hypothetical protein
VPRGGHLVGAYNHTRKGDRHAMVTPGCSRFHRAVAQLVEQRSPKPPFWGFEYLPPCAEPGVGRLGREAARQSAKLVSWEVAGSSPARPTLRNLSGKLRSLFECYFPVIFPCAFSSTG